MLLSGQVGPQVVADGSTPSVRLGKSADVIISELQGRYYEQNYRGNSFFLSVAAAAGTAYTGAAGGTPLLALINPVGSGKNLVLKTVAISVVASATAAGTTQFRLYGGPFTATSTGTLTTGRSALTFASGGSVAIAVSNAALTSQTPALNYIITIGTYQHAVQLTSGGPTFMLCPPILWEPAGQLIIQPGAMIALGAVTIPTSMTNDATIFWDEIGI